MDKKVLLGLTLPELQEEIKQLGLPAFRAKQVYSWLMRGQEPDGMSNLPKTLREQLKENYTLGGAKIVKKLVSKKDGTIKYLYQLEDGQTVEGVLMTYSYGRTLCLSTQVGCAMGCSFCASTLGGLVRNLTAGEMLSQVIEAEKDNPVENGRSITNLVLMGMGEPFANYDNVVRFVRLASGDGLGISCRNISLSTCGLTEQLERFAQEKLPVTLAVSLHAADDETRKELMPVAKKYTIAQVLEAAKKYSDITGRRFIIEYALISGVNDRREDAVRLAALLKGMMCHVNLIPLNDVPERGYKGSSARAVAEFLGTLEERKISATRRREMGSDIMGACGQLRKRTLEGIDA